MFITTHISIKQAVGFINTFYENPNEKDVKVVRINFKQGFCTNTEILDQEVSFQHYV